MTVSAINASSGTYTGNGVTTSFPFTFDVGSSAEVVVQVNGLTVGGYGVSVNAGGEGGTVTFAAAPAVGVAIDILSNPDFSQGISFENAGEFLPESHDEVADASARRAIWLKAQHARFVRAPIGDQILELPHAADRASTFPRFDNTGYGIDLLSSAAMVGTMGDDIAAFVGEITKGDPGGNIGAIGLFIAASGLTIPAGANVVRTTGYSVRGIGIADYMEDAAVDAAYVTANPYVSFRDTAGRGFRLVQSDGIADVTKWGALPDGTADNTARIIAAAAYLGANGGGMLFFPAGVFKVTAYIPISANTKIRGINRIASRITSTHAGGGGANAGENLRNGSVFVSWFAINSSTAANIDIEDICIENTNSANIGAAYYDRGGSFIRTRRVRYKGFKYGEVLDQSEITSDYENEYVLQNSGGAGRWLVNGADLTPGVAADFTNVNDCDDCQFNENSDVYCNLDDGGYNHSYGKGNNYNGGINAIRCAGLLSGVIAGGGFESQSGHIIDMFLTSLSGLVSSTNLLTVYDGTYSATGGHSSINCNPGAGTLAIMGAPVFTGGGGTAYALAGLVNLAKFYVGGPAANGTVLGSLYDPADRASVHVDTFGEQHILAGTKLIFDDPAGPAYEAYTEKVASSPYRILNIAQRGGTGGWSGAIALQVGSDLGAPYDAFRVRSVGAGVSEAEAFGPMIATEYNIGADIVLAGKGAAIVDAVFAAGATPTAAEFNAVVTAFNTVLARMRAATPSIAT